jgi:hypothetical protein
MLILGSGFLLSLLRTVWHVDSDSRHGRSLAPASGATKAFRAHVAHRCSSGMVSHMAEKDPRDPSVLPGNEDNSHVARPPSLAVYGASCHSLHPRSPSSGHARPSQSRLLRGLLGSLPPRSVTTRRPRFPQSVGP